MKINPSSYVSQNMSWFEQFINEKIDVLLSQHNISYTDIFLTILPLGPTFVLAKIINPYIGSKVYINILFFIASILFPFVLFAIFSYFRKRYKNSRLKGTIYSSIPKNPEKKPAYFYNVMFTKLLYFYNSCISLKKEGNLNDYQRMFLNNILRELLCSVNELYHLLKDKSWETYTLFNAENDEGLNNESDRKKNKEKHIPSILKIRWYSIIDFYNILKECFQICKDISSNDSVFLERLKQTDECYAGSYRADIEAIKLEFSIIDSLIKQCSPSGSPDSM